MATCAITGSILDASGTAMQSVTVAARVPNPVVSSTDLIAPMLLSVQTDSSGAFTITLQQSISVIFTVQYPVIGTDPQRIYSYTGNVPASATADFTSVIVQEV